MPNFIETGNPGLQSEKSNKVSLTYTNFGTVAGGNIGIEYAAIDNAISPFYYTKDDITYESVANIGHDRRLAFSDSSTGRLFQECKCRSTQGLLARCFHHIHLI